MEVLSVMQQSGSVVMEIVDDGRGISRDVVLRALHQKLTILIKHRSCPIGKRYNSSFDLGLRPLRNSRPSQDGVLGWT